MIGNQAKHCEDWIGISDWNEPFQISAVPKLAMSLSCNILVAAEIWDLTKKINIKNTFLLFQTIDFPQRFFETPALVTTTKHSKDDVNSRIDADNNAITEWIEVTIYFCLRFFTTYCLWNSFLFLTQNILSKLISDQNFVHLVCSTSYVFHH